MNKHILGLAASLLLLTPLASCSLSMSSVTSSSSEPVPASSSVPFSSSSVSLTPVKSFTITFLNWDKMFLASVTVEQGQDAVYEGVTPTRDPDVQYTYTFSGWDLSLTDIQADGNRIAQYSNVLNRYTITFKDYDDSELEKSSWGLRLYPDLYGDPDSAGRGPILLCLCGLVP